MIEDKKIFENLDIQEFNILKKIIEDCMYIHYYFNDDEIVLESCKTKESSDFVNIEGIRLRALEIELSEEFEKRISDWVDKVLRLGIGYVKYDVLNNTYIFGNYEEGDLYYTPFSSLPSSSIKSSTSSVYHINNK